MLPWNACVCFDLIASTALSSCDDPTKLGEESAPKNCADEFEIDERDLLRRKPLDVLDVGVGRTFSPKVTGKESRFHADAGSGG